MRALRLAVQDIALSRRRHGFDSRRACQFSYFSQPLPSDFFLPLSQGKKEEFPS